MRAKERESENNDRDRVGEPVKERDGPIERGR